MSQRQLVTPQHVGSYVLGGRPGLEERRRQAGQGGRKGGGSGLDERRRQAGLGGREDGWTEWGGQAEQDAPWSLLKGDMHRISGSAADLA
jgi:hypothetical protein